MTNALSQCAKGLLGLSAVLISGTAIILYVYQTSLIYPSNLPEGSRVDVMTPDEFDLPYEDITLTSNQYKIKAYFISSSDSTMSNKRPTVIIFHANAGNMGHRLPIAQMFYFRMKLNILMVSYRGYGKSEGTPTEKGLQEDAKVALDFVLQHPKTNNTPIYLYGQSIGGAVCIDLASRYPEQIKAMIIENTFTSIPDLIPSLLPLLKPFKFLCTEVWNSKSSIRRIGKDTHVLFLSGNDDEIVPNSHMKLLYKLVNKDRNSSEKYNSNNVLCQFHSFPFGTHNDTCLQLNYWDIIFNFLENVKYLTNSSNNNGSSSNDELEWSYEEIKKPL